MRPISLIKALPAARGARSFDRILDAAPSAFLVIVLLKLAAYLKRSIRIVLRLGRAFPLAFGTHAWAAA